MKPTTISFLASVALAAGCGGREAMSGSATAPASGSQIGKDAAGEIALREVPGTVVDEEYEEERGGWVYPSPAAAPRSTSPSRSTPGSSTIGWPLECGAVREPQGSAGAEHLIRDMLSAWSRS